MDGLSVSYGGIGAVHGVGLRVGAGQVVAVVGPNGAGKTSLLGAVMGVVPGRGAVRFRGADVGGLAAEDRVRAGLCLVPEKRELFGSMTVEDNLRLGGFRFRAEGARAARRGLDEVFALFPRLRERRRQEAATLSGGERQMLAMGRALMARPDLLMVALGQPKGELWLAEHLEELGVPASVQVGATLDFVAGRVRRAPRPIQKVGMEWAYRIYTDRARLARLLEEWARALGA